MRGSKPSSQARARDGTNTPLLGRGKPLNTLHLTDAVLASDPNNRAALEVRLKVLEYLQERCENYVEAGYLDYGIKRTKEKLASK